MSLPLHKLHRELYLQLKKKALKQLPPKTDQLLSYHKNKKKFEERPFKTSSFKELKNSLLKSQLIYLGDFHPFDQNSKNVERILRLLKEERKLIIGVEFIEQKHQPYIDAYCDKQMTELEFLQEIQFRESWRFPWRFHRPIFKLAQEKKFKIVALNSTGPLDKRDLQAAQVIAQTIQTEPHSKMIVFFGEYHIVPNKLPSLVQKFSKKKLRQTIIHQNLDVVFWQLARSEKFLGERIVRFNNHEFSLQTSTPWLKYDSLVYWLENIEESSESHIYEATLESRYAGREDSDELFVQILNAVCKIFELKINSDQLEDFNLYQYYHHDIVMKKLDQVPIPKLKRFYLKKVMTGQAFKLPFSTLYFCPYYSVNRLALISGQHLFHIITDGLNEEMALTSSTKLPPLYMMTCRQAFGYLSAKAINPYRKCDLLNDLLKKEQVASEAQKRIYRPLLSLLTSSKRKDFLKSSLKTLKLHEIEEVAQHLGNILGETLFQSTLNSQMPWDEDLVYLLVTFDMTNENFFELLEKSIDRYPGYWKEKSYF